MKKSTTLNLNLTRLKDLSPEDANEAVGGKSITADSNSCASRCLCTGSCC